MAIFEIGSERLTELAETTFAVEGILERQHLQGLVRDQIEIISPNCMVLDEEFGHWEDSRRRIDLLALDRDANLVVVELKRTEGDPRRGHLLA